MKRGILGLILILVIFLSLTIFIKPVSSAESDSVSCCCNVQGWEIYEGFRRGTCVSNLNWVPKAGADKACEEECRDLCGEDCDPQSATFFVSSLAGAGCSGIDDTTPDGYSKCIPVCGDGYKSEGEECEENSDCGSASNVYCSGCKCRMTEICNNIDDDKDGMVDEDDSKCGNYSCFADAGDCPIDSVCSSSPATITGAVGEDDKQCKICKSVCKVCPPHPPKATRNNPLGICASEKDGGYPFSKECIDYLNMVSCMTCDGTTQKARKNEGSFGVNQKGEPIWSGTNKPFPKLEGNNKDVKGMDKINEYNDEGIKVDSGGLIDCRYAMPIISSLKNTFPIHEDNAFYGICSGMMCVPKECVSDCGEDRGYEKWHDSSGNKVSPVGPFVNLAKTCSSGSYNGYTNLKYTGSWASLFSNKAPNCRVEKQGNQGTCYYDMNGKKLKVGYGEPIEEYIRLCKSKYKDKAYYYIATNWD